MWCTWLGDYCNYSVDCEVCSIRINALDESKVKKVRVRVVKPGIGGPDQTTWADEV